MNYCISIILQNTVLINRVENAINDINLFILRKLGKLIEKFIIFKKNNIEIQIIISCYNKINTNLLSGLEVLNLKIKSISECSVDIFFKECSNVIKNIKKFNFIIHAPSLEILKELILNVGKTHDASKINNLLSDTSKFTDYTNIIISKYMQNINEAINNQINISNNTTPSDIIESKNMDKISFVRIISTFMTAVLICVCAYTVYNYNLIK